MKEKKSLVAAFKDKKTVFYLIGIVILLMIGFYLPSKVMVTTSDSLDHRIFLFNPFFDPSAIHKGDYVVFNLTSRFINNGKSIKATKRVMCEAGDMLTVDRKAYYCNGKFLGLAKEHSLKGEPVANFEYNGIVPDQKLFIIGTHKDSFDSRYFGLLDRKDIKAKAVPVW